MKEALNDAVTRHLLEAIERVRDDVSKVEFWAGAVAGFARPVPEYTPDEASVWLPTEQASTLRSTLRGPDSLGEPNSPHEPESRRTESRRTKSGNNKKSSRSKPPARPRG